MDHVDEAIHTVVDMYGLYMYSQYAEWKIYTYTIASIA